METRKDIYNLWVQYTTKNDETFFRQFITGFVQIWEEQLNLNFDDPPDWKDIKGDQGPHISRLPDELLPAIGKFLIIGKDRFQNDKPQTSSELIDTTLLVRCLIVMCRHFDNINTVANYEYISSVVTISITIVISLFKNQRKPTQEEIDYIIATSQLIEVIYDPYFTWRNFLRGEFADYRRITNNVVPLHVEVVPFIYDCFQFPTLLMQPEIATHVIHMLGAIICGSQNNIAKQTAGASSRSMSSSCSNSSLASNSGDGKSQTTDDENGLRAICPATVSVLINLLSKWECHPDVRTIGLKCFSVMAIVLQRSSSAERQIELLTILQLYLDVIYSLLKTKHFLPKAYAEKTTTDDTNDTEIIDTNALTAAIDNFEILLSDKISRTQVCYAIVEANFVGTFANIPRQVKQWDFDSQALATSILQALVLLSRHSSQIVANLKTTKNIMNLFSGIRTLGKPSRKLLETCIRLAYDDEKKCVIYAEVVIKLIEWIKDMHENEQNLISDSLLRVCLSNFISKSIVTQQRAIKTICHALQHCSSLSNKCAIDLIKLLEELAKYSISPVELKSVFYLLRREENFDYRKQLLQSLATISLHNVSNNTVCNEFLDIQSRDDGITVPEIHKWVTSGSYGFIFHGWIRLDEVKDWEPDPITESTRFRRVIFSLLTTQGTGYEIFVDSNGKIVIGITTRKEYLATSVSGPSLIDKKWHLLTVGIIPPKRPFAYTQITCFIDEHQRLGATIKFGAFTEPFSYCNIGTAYQKARRTSASSVQQKSQEQAPPVTPEPNSKGMFPSLMEKTFLPQIVSQVPSYFSLPIRNKSSSDPNVKCYPIGMQDGVFGPQTCLRGQLGTIVVAEPTTSIKTLTDAGPNFASVISQDIEPYDLAAKYVFCYSPNSCHGGLCVDLVPGSKLSGHVVAKFCRTCKIQDAINSIGGIYTLLPILDTICKSEKDAQELFFASLNSIESDVMSPTTAEVMGEWEVLASTTYTEWKIIQNPLACFLCLIRHFSNGHKINQEHMLKSDCVGTMAAMLATCSPHLIDVNVLMASHLLIESVQNLIPTPNIELLSVIYSDFIFDFKIWSRAPFQVTIGHVQYISTMIKRDRNHFRKKFGVQFFLDTIRQYYSGNNEAEEDDVQAVRTSLLDIIKYYIQKDLNAKEVSVLICYIASASRKKLIIEMLELLTAQMNSKHCKDQIFLLMHEVQTADLCYSLLADRHFDVTLQTAVLKFIGILLNTKRVSKKYKLSLRLHDATVPCQSLYPGLISYLLPLEVEKGITLTTLDQASLVLDQTVTLTLLEQALADESGFGYCGALHLIHHLSGAELDLKLEVARRLLTTTFNKINSPFMVAKQIGWQESISRLLVRKLITLSDIGSGAESKDIPFEESGDFTMDLMTFDEKTLELSNHSMSGRDHNVILNEIQASVTEAANVIEHEIKEMAESVTEKVAGNISSVYSMIRQTTSDIQDTLESLTSGQIDLKHQKSFTTASTLSSNSTSEENLSVRSSKDNTSKTDPSETGSMRSALGSLSSTGQEDNIHASKESIEDKEEQLVYLITNILFTILWRGIENNGGDSWKERGQVLACINLLGLNNELYSSHLTLRLRILELSIQAALIDLADVGNQNQNYHQNATQLLRMVYDLVVLDPNEDEIKKCSPKLLDGVLALLDNVMLFQQATADGSLEMTRLCFGLLLKCSHHPNTEVVAMATAKLHALLQSRSSQDTQELGYLFYRINKTLDAAIEVGNSEQYAFLMPVLKALLEKSRVVLGLSSHAPDLPPTSSGPVFFNDFQMYSCSNQWTTFIETKIKPLHDAYQAEVSSTLWEPLNTFWAECYEACKSSSQKRAKQLMESRRKFQQKILMPWRMRQSEEITRLGGLQIQRKTREIQIERRWRTAKRFLHSSKGTFPHDTRKEEFWRLSHHENPARMRLKLEPSLYHDPHTGAANLRDNTANTNDDRRVSTEFGSSITSAVIRDILTEDEVILLEEEMKSNAEPQPSEIPVEKVVISQECELVTLMTRVKGRLEVTSRMFTFIDLDQVGESGERYDFKFPIIQIKEVHLRKYNLRRSALEVFLVDQTSYFLNFTTKTRNKVFSKILSIQPPNILYGSGRSPSELLRNSGLTQKWVNREISNFEYLMQLNTIAGRSYNDLSQYPVFPWVLTDYTSTVLDLSDPKSFRDLSKPIGVVNPRNETEVRAKYEGFEDPTGVIPKFHYGTHYSNSAGVLHYLIRVEPFTSLHIELQSGRFDVADRQFHSIPQTFKLLMENPNDVKELIPEFYYFPEFLKNMNKFDLGVLQNTRERVNDVILPPWAKSPEDFITIHRRALESEYVSQNLHHWIDLIFGYKQKGPKAVEALNVFYYCSYEGAVDLDKITNAMEREAVEGMINNFGQTPTQLLKEAHPRRLTKDEALAKLIKFELKRPDLTAFFDRIVVITHDLATDKDPIAFLSIPRSPPKSFLQVSPDVLVSISKNAVLGCNSWVAHEKDKGFVLEIDATTSNLKNRKRLSGPFHPALNLHSQLFAVSLDGRHIYAAGVWDNSLKVISVNRGKTVASITRHFDVITCIAFDNCGSYIVTGSKDCTCIVWSLNHVSTGLNHSASSSSIPHGTGHNQADTSNSLTPCPLNTLYGHENSVSCVAIFTELDIVVSGSVDGTVNVHTIKDGQFVRTLSPIGCTGSSIEISYIALSYQGHIVFSALDDTSHSVHAYSINGTHLGSKYVSARVTGLATSGDYAVVADDAGDINISLIYGLKLAYTKPLHVPIQTIVVTPRNTHILAPLRDGKLAVIGVAATAKQTKKAHSVINI